MPAQSPFTFSAFAIRKFSFSDLCNRKRIINLKFMVYFSVNVGLGLQEILEITYVSLYCHFFKLSFLSWISLYWIPNGCAKSYSTIASYKRRNTFQAKRVQCKERKPKRRRLNLQMTETGNERLGTHQCVTSFKSQNGSNLSYQQSVYI